jgi:hypothetical protein
MLIATELGDRAVDARCAAFVGDTLRRRGAWLVSRDGQALAAPTATVGASGHGGIDQEETRDGTRMTAAGGAFGTRCSFVQNACPGNWGVGWGRLGVVGWWVDDLFC